MKRSLNVAVTEFRLKLYPQDFIASRDFYENFLGFPVIKEWDRGIEDRGIMFNVGGTVLELLTAHAREKISGADLSLEVPDVRRLWEEFKNLPNIAHALRDNSWGDISFSIFDTEGFRITFFTRK